MVPLLPELAESTLETQVRRHLAVASIREAAAVETVAIEKDIHRRDKSGAEFKLQF